MRRVQREIVFNLYIEQIDPGNYWGCITEIPHLSRVIGDNMPDIRHQLLIQMAHLISEMPEDYFVKVKKQVVINIP
jgi:hypothetical protein